MTIFNVFVDALTLRITSFFSRSLKQNKYRNLKGYGVMRPNKIRIFPFNLIFGEVAENGKKEHNF